MSDNGDGGERNEERGAGCGGRQTPPPPPGTQPPGGVQDAGQLLVGGGQVLQGQLSGGQPGGDDGQGPTVQQPQGGQAADHVQGGGQISSEQVETSTRTKQKVRKK